MISGSRFQNLGGAVGSDWRSSSRLAPVSACSAVDVNALAKPRGAVLSRSAPDGCVQGSHGGASPLATFADVEVVVGLNANLDGVVGRGRGGGSFERRPGCICFVEGALALRDFRATSRCKGLTATPWDRGHRQASIDKPPDQPRPNSWHAQAAATRDPARERQALRALPESTSKRQ